MDEAVEGPGGQTRKGHPMGGRAMRHGPHEGFGAGDEVRTRDMQLGRLPLCQLSYSRPRREVYQAPFDDLAKDETSSSTIDLAALTSRSDS